MSLRDEVNIGFLGFGEAGSQIARGLRGAGISCISAFDINTHTPGLGERIQQRARESEAVVLETNAELTANSDILFSTVTANRAFEAAEQTAPFLRAQQIYADLNSVSPKLKQSIGQLIAAHGGRFVEGAIMSPVSPHGHRVPMLLGGTHAQAFTDALACYGMRLEIVSDQIGVAAATKMCRSIIIKGLEALMFECLLAAHQYGAEERVFVSLAETFPGVDWSKLADYMIGRVVEHGERRAREMEEVAETLRAAGIEPIMAEATARRQDWCAGLKLREHFKAGPPENYGEVLHAIDDAVTK